MKSTPSPAAAGQRRRPQQSRARQTEKALRQAFVQVLVERGWDAVTVREVTLVAGTALGSFYDYFSSKEDLARVSLHLRSKQLLVVLRQATEAGTGQSMADIAAAAIDALLQAHRARPRDWAAHYLLERHFSGLAAYRQMYQRFIDAWAAALNHASDLKPDFPLQDAARVCQTIVYGLFVHAHLQSADGPDHDRLRREARTAVMGYLRELARPGPPPDQVP
ncbi:MAG: TetR/AcrR family transcriptional regulator [Ottowia sp.]|nr:TetR/AcrR family transcriptional regulator [Ottowia sp.]